MKRCPTTFLVLGCFSLSAAAPVPGAAVLFAFRLAMSMQGLTTGWCGTRIHELRFRVRGFLPA